MGIPTNQPITWVITITWTTTGVMKLFEYDGKNSWTDFDEAFAIYKKAESRGVHQLLMPFRERKEIEMIKLDPEGREIGKLYFYGYDEEYWDREEEEEEEEEDEDEVEEGETEEEYNRRIE